ncbi:MAG TPA: polysaccharide deacetylase family protein [Planctomycetaceae bacterium]|jgi:sialate O-acetylesterase
MSILPTISEGVVSLSFDDALDEHLDFAVPLLGERGLTGTFYVPLSASGFTTRLEEWRAAADRGHELGNHTIFHPADRRKPWVRQGNEIDRYTLDRMRQELEVANRLLQALDGCPARTFAYPCSNSILGQRGMIKQMLFKFGFERTRLPAIVDRWHLDWGSTETSYAPIVQNLFLASRGGGLTKDCAVPELAVFDRFKLPSVAIAGWSLGDLIEYTERGLSGRTWVILQFHGVGGGHRMNCDLRVFREFVTWLYDNCRDRVATIRDVAACLWAEARNDSRHVDLTPAPL